MRTTFSATRLAKRYRWIVGIVLFLIAAPSFAKPVIRPIVLSGTAAPGAEADTVFSAFGGRYLDAPTLNAQGKVAFTASLSGQSINDSNDLGVWTYDGTAGLTFVARTGTPTPGLPEGVVIDAILPRGGELSLSNNGSVFFPVELSGSTINRVFNDALLTGNSDADLSVVIREQTPFPGLPVDGLPSDTSISRSNLTDRGYRVGAAGSIVADVGLAATGISLDNSHALVSTRGPAELNLITRHGKTVAGLPSSVTQIGSWEATINGAGKIAYLSRLQGPGVSNSNNEVILRNEGGATNSLVARAGQQAPGMAPGTVFKGFSMASLTESGNAAFFAGIAGPGSEFGHGIWLEVEGLGLKRVLTGRSQAPGLEEGVNIDYIGGFYPRLSANGHLAIYATLQGTGIDFTNNIAIWVGDTTGQLRLVSQSGKPLPGITDGTVVGNFDLPVVNANGQIAFAAQFTDNSVDRSRKNALFAEDTNGDLQLILQQGDTIDTNRDPLFEDLRTVASFQFATDFDRVGAAEGFNDSGQLAFSVTFTDGTSGIFLADLNAIPEPAALLIAALALAGGMFQRLRS